MPQPPNPVDDQELPSLYARTPRRPRRNLLHITIDRRLHYSTAAQNHIRLTLQKTILLARHQGIKQFVLNDSQKIINHGQLGQKQSLSVVDSSLRKHRPKTSLCNVSKHVHGHPGAFHYPMHHLSSLSLKLQVRPHWHLLVRNCLFNPKGTRPKDDSLQ